MLDYGCGYGALRSYLRERGHRGHYVGFDISERMIEAARAGISDDAARFSTDRRALDAHGLHPGKRHLQCEAGRV